TADDRGLILSYRTDSSTAVAQPVAHCCGNSLRWMMSSGYVACLARRWKGRCMSSRAGTESQSVAGSRHMLARCMVVALLSSASLGASVYPVMTQAASLSELLESAQRMFGRGTGSAAPASQEAMGQAIRESLELGTSRA